jgi:hypothetical protein
VMVCDICWNPEIAASGRPEVNKNGRTSVQLFGRDWNAGSVDLCSECIEFMQRRDWHGLAERAQAALIKQLES